MSQTGKVGGTVIISVPEEGQGRVWRSRVLILVLIVLATAIHAWTIAHTIVPARDSIGFIRYAWRLRHEPYQHVLQTSLHPPLYPLTVLAVSKPLRRVLALPDALVMQYSAQLASALAGVLLVIPVFHLGRKLFDRQVGFWAAALFQILPVGARALGDGLSEGIFLLLAALSLLSALYALERGSPVLFGLCGLFSGLAYLARPEGLLLAGVAGLVLLGMQARPAWRRGWGRVVAGGLALTAGTAVAAGPYMNVIHGLTNKTTGLELLSADAAEGPAGKDVPAPTGRVGGPLLALLPADFVHGWNEANHRPGQLWWCLQAVARELGKGFYYAAWLPALLGLWWFRDRFTTVPGTWTLLLLSLFQLGLLFRLATGAGYVSERHTLLIVLCGVFWAVAGIRAVPGQMSALGSRLGMPPRVVDWWGYRRGVERLLLILLVAYSLPSTLRTLHPSRAGHRAAGDWLAAHLDRSDAVDDPFCWAHFYAGRVFSEGQPPAVTPGHTPLWYVVLDNASPHSRIPTLEAARERAKRGWPVFHWPAQQPLEQASVLVYAVPHQLYSLPLKP